MKRLMLLVLALVILSMAVSAIACPDGQWRVRLDDVCGATRLINQGYTVYFRALEVPSGEVVLR